MRANIACRAAIESAIARNYKDNYLQAQAVTQALENHSMERILLVLANTVQGKVWDARFTQDNKAWAKAFPIHIDDDHRYRFVVDKAHPGLTDMFLTMARRQADILETQKEAQ